MSRWTDRRYLRDEQYRCADNLNPRAALHQRFSANPYPWQRWVFDHLNLPADGSIPELGCGPGDLWVDNRYRIPDSWRITLSDLSVGMVEQARKRVGRGPCLFAYCTVDAQALPFLCDEFDVVVANHRVYHVARAENLLHEVRRVLAPRGRFFAATNGINPMRELRDLVSQFVPGWESENVAERFGLENGGAMLSAVFEEITMSRQINSLAVTEAEPPLACIRSTLSSGPSHGGLKALKRCVRRPIAVEGAIEIVKDVSMFVARKAQG